MAKQSKLKRCGHVGCSLNTPECCGCEDRRWVSNSYSRYVDGIGYIEDTSPNARYHGYCTPCRTQFENLLPGRKRCACGVVTCNLTTNQCCICLDERPAGETYYRYEDGKGMVETSATRWMHYCPPCRKRCCRQLRRVLSDEAYAQCANTTAFCEVPPLALIDQPSTLEPESNITFTSLDSQTGDVVKPTSGSTIAEQVKESSEETCDMKDSSGEVSIAFADVQDYEIVNHDNLYPSGHIVINNKGIEKYAGRNGSHGHWWNFIWKH